MVSEKTHTKLKFMSTKILLLPEMEIVLRVGSSFDHPTTFH